MPTTKSPPSREAGTSTRVGRTARRRLTGSHLLIAVVVVLAFALNLIALQERDDVTLVAVADGPLSAGSLFMESAVRFVPVDSDFEGLGSLVSEAEITGFEGWVLERPIPDGAIIDESALAAPGAPSGLRSMSIPVAVEHAAGGSLAVGDRVDVITVTDGIASFVAVDVEVVGVSPDESGSFGAVGSYYVVLGVGPTEALALAEAIDHGSVEIVRSTGATEIDARNLDES